MKIKNPTKEIEIVSAVIPPEDVELMVEPKRSCKKCFGRGYELYVEGDGYKTIKKEIPHLQTGIGAVVTKETVLARVENMKRISRPCACVFRHARFKLRAAAAKAKFSKKPKLDPESFRSDVVPGSE